MFYTILLTLIILFICLTIYIIIRRHFPRLERAKQISYKEACFTRAECELQAMVRQIYEQERGVALINAIPGPLLSNTRFCAHSQLKHE